MYLSFTEDTDLWDARFAALKLLAESQVDVGLTSSASAHSQMLMAIHEHGALVTVSVGWIYNCVAKKGVHVEGKGFDKPTV